MRWIVVVVVAALAACSRSAPEKVPTCAELTEHLFAVTKIAYPGHGDMEMGNRNAEVAACEARKPSPGERRCMMAAKDLAGVAACRKPSVQGSGSAPRP